MPLTDFISWLEEVSARDYIVYAKQLSRNDTQATGGHQSGPYIPKDIAFSVFPDLQTDTEANPRRGLSFYIDSHIGPQRSEAKMIYYRSKNEARMTGFGGSVLLDSESAGMIAVFAFDSGARRCKIWVIDNEMDEAYFDSFYGEIHPKKGSVILKYGTRNTQNLLSPPMDCKLSPNEILPEWHKKFPTPTEMFEMAMARRPLSDQNPDIRIHKRRECETEIFHSIEEARFASLIQNRYSNVSELVSAVYPVIQARRARSGRSLELHVKKILLEEELVEDTDFSHEPVIEGGKKPDFLFPSKSAYENLAFPDDKLRMLAVKTTLKDRWRQILDEAGRIRSKHLLTMGTRISRRQFDQMVKAKVQLVVPKKLHTGYLDEIKPHLMTLEDFIAEIRDLAK